MSKIHLIVVAISSVFLVATFKGNAALSDSVSPPSLKTPYRFTNDPATIQEKSLPPTQSNGWQCPSGYFLQSTRSTGQVIKHINSGGINLDFSDICIPPLGPCGPNLGNYRVLTDTSSQWSSRWSDSIERAPNLEYKCVKLDWVKI